MNDSPRDWIDGLTFAAATDIGMRRLNNQDSYVILTAEDHASWMQRGHLFVVADGMGAHAAGELASKLAADGVAHHYRKQKAISAPEAILQAVRETNQEIHQRGQANTEFHNMGTTCSALVVLPQGAFVAHVGDSRVYRVRGRRIDQLTFDHSLVWEMRATGSLAREQILNVPKNVITRSLGPQAAVQVDLEGPHAIEQGDGFLLCSDGLTSKLEDEELGAIVATLPPAEAANLLVDLANVRGGPDNITVIIVRAEGPAAASNHWRARPLVVGQSIKPPPQVHVSFWITSLVALLVAGGLGVTRRFVWAATAAAVGGLALLFALLQRTLQDQPSGVALDHGRRLGRAPYATADAVLSEELAERFVASVREALELCDHQWPDHDRAEACVDEAQTSFADQRPAEGLRMLGVAARLVAGHFRTQRNASL